MELNQLKTWIEGALLAAGQPLSLTQLNSLFDEDQQPGHGTLREALALLDAELQDRAFELVEVAGGYRLQIRAQVMPVVSRLWAEKSPRYSRALLETLAIIAYRQPITRGEIEQIRGVSLSANILKTLQEREWIRVVGQRDIPGRPELLGTTRAFLDYFGLKGLDDLPTLAEIRDLDTLEPELDFGAERTHEDSDNEQAAETLEETDEATDEAVAESIEVDDEARDGNARSDAGDPAGAGTGPEDAALEHESSERHADEPEAAQEDRHTNPESAKHPD